MVTRDTQQYHLVKLHVVLLMWAAHIYTYTRCILTAECAWRRKKHMPARLAAAVIAAAAGGMHFVWAHTWIWWMARLCTTAKHMIESTANNDDDDDDYVCANYASTDNLAKCLASKSCANGRRWKSINDIRHYEDFDNVLEIGLRQFYWWQQIMYFDEGTNRGAWGAVVSKRVNWFMHCFDRSSCNCRRLEGKIYALHDGARTDPFISRTFWWRYHGFLSDGCDFCWVDEWKVGGTVSAWAFLKLMMQYFFDVRKFENQIYIFRTLLRMHSKMPKHNFEHPLSQFRIIKKWKIFENAIRNSKI